MPRKEPLTKEEVLDKINKGESFEGVEIAESPAGDSAREGK